MQDFRPICQIRWVRIPPPPYKNGLTFVRPVFILCGVGENTCNLTGHFICTHKKIIRQSWLCV